MTTVTYFDKDNEISIDISGHAGYDVEGSDVVCAAISMLGQTLLAYLETDNDEFKFLLKEGRIWAYAKGANVRTALNVIMAGFYLLARDYPDYVTVDRGCCMQKSSRVID